MIIKYSKSRFFRLIWVNAKLFTKYYFSYLEYQKWELLFYLYFFKMKILRMLVIIFFHFLDQKHRDWTSKVISLNHQSEYFFEISSLSMMFNPALHYLLFTKIFLQDINFQRTGSFWWYFNCLTGYIIHLVSEDIWVTTMWIID